MDELTAMLNAVLGFTNENLDVSQMTLRGVLVYGAMVTLVRVGKKRFLGAATAFDIILGIIIGSIASRAITGGTPFVPALTTVAALIVLHWVLSVLSMHWDAFGALIKGHDDALIVNGKVDQPALRRALLSKRDLGQALRTHGISSLDEVIEARLERNGQISLIRARRKPEVLEISVAEGVQTVRVELR